jgi:aromatic-amino-acid transaminase
VSSMNPPPSRALTPRSALISAALERPGDDPIFALHSEAVRRRNAGESILNATLGALLEDDGRLAVMPVVREALEAVDPLRAAAYAPIAGEPEFLAAAIRDVFGSGPAAARAVAAATPGGTGALHHAIVNFLEPGQALLTTDYHWGPYETLAVHTGRRVATFEMFAPHGGFHLKAFERALRELVARQGRALVLLNTPCHNPTGYSLDSRERAALANILREVGQQAPVTLLLDLAYASFGKESCPEIVRDFEDLGEDAVLLVAWTVSKAFAQYGARIGALLATHSAAEERRRIASALSFSCRGTWSNCNHLGMLAITDLLSDPHKRARSERERARLSALLGERVRAFNDHAARAGLRYPRYEGGFFVTVFTQDGATCARRMRELGVYVVPAGQAVRVALCSTPVAEVPRLVAALVEGRRAAGG